MKDHIRAGLDREVTRQEFLTILGLITASVFGFGTIIKLLTGGHEITRPAAPKPVTTGYGVSSYGR